jgi:hypothetical protein
MFAWKLILMGVLVEPKSGFGSFKLSDNVGLWLFVRE